MLSLSGFARYPCWQRDFKLRRARCDSLWCHNIHPAEQPCEQLRPMSQGMALWQHFLQAFTPMPSLHMWSPETGGPFDLHSVLWSLDLCCGLSTATTRFSESNHVPHAGFMRPRPDETGIHWKLSFCRPSVSRSVTLLPARAKVEQEYSTQRSGFIRTGCVCCGNSTLHSNLSTASELHTRWAQRSALLKYSPTSP